MLDPRLLTAGHESLEVFESAALHRRTAGPISASGIGLTPEERQSLIREGFGEDDRADDYYQPMQPNVEPSSFGPPITESGSVESSHYADAIAAGRVALGSEMEFSARHRL